MPEKFIRVVRRLTNAERQTRSVLSNLGFKPGTIDTDFSSRTADELKQFQAAVGLEPTGVLDAKTLSQLKSALARVRNSPEAVQLGTKSERNALTESSSLGWATGLGVADAGAPSEG